MKKNTIMLNIRLIPCAAYQLSKLSHEDCDLMVDLFLDAMEYGSYRSFYVPPGFTIAASGKKTARTAAVRGQKVKSKIFIGLSIFRRMRKFVAKGYSVSWIIQESLYYNIRSDYESSHFNKAA